ncbi:MAG: tetratricopeptide repeat protein [Myxococcota bacterium]
MSHVSTAFRSTFPKRSGVCASLAPASLGRGPRLSSLLPLLFPLLLLLPAGCGGTAAPKVDPEALIQQSNELFKVGKVDDLVELLRDPVSSLEVDPRLRLIYGRALIRNNQATLAIFPLERLVSAPDATPAARALFVTALYQGGAVLEAIREASSFLEEYPENVNVRRMRADAHKAALMMEEALEDLSYLADNRPEDARALEAQLDLLVELDRVDEARDTLEDLGELMDQDKVLPTVKSNFCAARARFENDHGEPAVGLAMLDECVKEFPKDPTVLLSRVDVLEAVEGEDAATAYLREVAETTPGRFRVQYALGSRLLRLGEVEEAEAVMLRASKTVGGAQPSLALADFRVSQRDFKGASEAVLEGIRLQLGKGPGDPDFSWTELPVEAQFAFGDLFITAEDFERAEEIVAVIDDEQEAYRLILQARLQLSKGDAAQALETYEEAFRLWPSNPGARYLAGVAAMKVGEFDRAAGYYQDALRSDAAANDAGLVLANMQLAQGYPGAAVDTLGTYSREHEADPYSLRLFGRAAVMAGLFQFGEGARARLATDVDWAGIALADQALDLARVRGAEPALEYIESSEELFNESHFEAMTVWADLLTQTGQGDRGVKKVKSLYTSNREKPGYVIAWSRMLARDGEWEKARALLEPIAEANPTLLAAQRDFGTVLMKLGEVDEAIERYDRADQLAPLDPAAAFLACEGLIENGRTALAAERLEVLLERHPWHGGAAHRFAELRIAEGDLGERTQILAKQAARFIVISGPQSYITLGELELKIGNAKEAAEWLGYGMARGAGTPSAHFAFATALVESGRPDAGRKELESVLAGPDFPEAEQARAALQALGASPQENPSADPAEKAAG